MYLRHSFKPYVGKSAIGHVNIDGCSDKFTVGVRCIQLENFESQIIASLMESKSGLSRGELMTVTCIPSHSLFDQVFMSLMAKLSVIDIANCGGNGSYFEETIYASELIRQENGQYKFNHDLANIIGQRKPELSDFQLYSINFRPKASL